MTWTWGNSEGEKWLCLGCTEYFEGSLFSYLGVALGVGGGMKNDNWVLV